METKIDKTSFFMETKIEKTSFLFIRYKNEKVKKEETTIRCKTAC